MGITHIANGHIQPGDWLEFGVASGWSINNELSKWTTETVYGFDSFEGLPEDWRDAEGNLQEPKGRFRCLIPTVRDNVRIVGGFFEDTLPKFLLVNKGPFGLVHIDCDLYSSTKFVLDQLEPYLDGVVIAFDEIGPFPAGDHHEGRAWREFLAKGTYTADLLGHQHTAGAVYKLHKC